MLANIGLPGLVVILLILVVLFGGKRIAEVAKGLGTGVKNFKDAVKEDEKGEEVQEIAEQKPKIVRKKTATPKTDAKTRTKKTAAK
ncbi:MAG: twin-arginine translocase TatA/TatE family subunit [Campylobacteraceae bacterium]|jgi:sec-independent protein translocase protein TatA|nr:twin-arginine translocase TatA/TatE family subunit [Campylobacteraceae bacterium]